MPPLLKSNQKGNLSTKPKMKSISCPKCPATFARTVHLDEHSIVHNRHEKHRCPFCSASFPHSIKEHLISTHLKISEPKCQTCFENVKINTKIRPIEDHGSNTIKCKKCENRYCSEIYLAVHNTRHDLEKACHICAKICLSMSENSRHLLTHSDIREFSCSRCNASFKEKKKLRRHENSVHSTKPATCPKCFKIYPSVLYLKQHVKLVHGNTYKCTLCPANKAKVFHSKVALKGHEQCKHNSIKRRYDCLVCCKSYSHPRTLSNHIALEHGSESGPKQIHRCTECNKTYTSAMGLWSHKQIKHKGVGERIACLICNKQFAHKELLRSHVRQVHGQKQYTCDVCQHVCKSALGLRIHKDHQHENPSQQHPCKLCSRIYKYESDLKMHISSKHINPRQTYTCLVCLRSYKSKKERNKHMKKMNHLNLPKCYVHLVRCKIVPVESI